jgi:hypothetical protein
MPVAPGYPHQLIIHAQMHNPSAYPGYAPNPFQATGYPAAHLPPPSLPGQANYYHAAAVSAPVASAHYYAPTPMGTNQGPLLSPRDMPAPVIDPRSSPSGMFTRNLIGSLCVSAFKLTCPDNNMGVWFILQDLSVRTEGSFR